MVVAAHVELSYDCLGSNVEMVGKFEADHEFNISLKIYNAHFCKNVHKILSFVNDHNTLPSTICTKFVISCNVTSYSTS